MMSTATYTEVTETDLFNALAYYLRDYEPVRDHYTLPPAANILGDALGVMLYNKTKALPWSHLTDEQQALLRNVFNRATTFPLL
jgi:hypothetical protein